MKQLLKLLFILITSSGIAQKVDWVHAPINPVAFKYTLQDFNLKGDIIAFNDKLFKDGKLMYDNAHVAKSYYEYDDNGKLTRDSEERTYTYNNKSQIISISDSPFKKDLAQNLKFEYDENGRLKSISDKTKKTEYTYNAEGRLKSEIVGSDGVKRTISAYTYSKENNPLRIIKEYGNYGSSDISREAFFYDKGVLVKKFDKNNFEYSWKTITDTQGNLLNENDITFTASELTKNFNLSVIEEKVITFFSANYNYKVFLNGKYAAFIPVETIDNTSVVFDILNKNYYRIDGKYQEKIGGAILTLLAKNKEAIFIKPKQYNKLHNLYGRYHLVYAGLNRNPNGSFLRHSKVNMHLIGDTSFILYDRFFDTNYYATVESGNSVYILNEALPHMFYIVEKPGGQLLFYFIHNGLEIETSRLQLEHANNEQDVNIFVDGKLTYGIKDYKALEKEKVYYPTVF